MSFLCLPLLRLASAIWHSSLWLTKPASMAGTPARSSLTRSSSPSSSSSSSLSSPSLYQISSDGEQVTDETSSGDEYAIEPSDEGETDPENVVQGSELSPADEDGRYRRVVDLLQGGHDLSVLRLEDCKAYLRKHGLRLTGAKAICIERIHEHWMIKDGNGLKLYPRSSFVINCKGDVCTGDVVLFTQRVYEKFDVASRGGGARAIGKRTIAGRVVKESYGAVKQQHTFTVEIVWSTGLKTLPPLFPLLVKGRNLYRLKTFRLQWPDESERKKVLAEKHKRGAAARHFRAISKVHGSSGGTRSDKRHQSRGSGSHVKYQKPLIGRGKALSSSTCQFKSKKLNASKAEAHPSSKRMRNNAPTLNEENYRQNFGLEKTRKTDRIKEISTQQSVSKSDARHLQDSLTFAGRGMTQRTSWGPYDLNGPLDHYQNRVQCVSPYQHVGRFQFSNFEIGSSSTFPARRYGLQPPECQITQRRHNEVCNYVGLSNATQGVQRDQRGDLRWAHKRMHQGVPSGAMGRGSEDESVPCSTPGCCSVGSRSCVVLACHRCCRWIGRRCGRHE